MNYGTYGCGRGQFLSNPPVNIIETENGYLLHLYSPSLKKENFMITTHNDILSIRYKDEKNPSAYRYTRREYRAEEIDRSFNLKGKVNIDGIKASYADGVLTIDLPKTDAAKRPSQDVTVH
jgi:HSP20 family protein